MIFLLLTGVSKKWSPAVVTRIQQDGNVLRHVKVFQIDGQLCGNYLSEGKESVVIHVGLSVEAGQE